MIARRLNRSALEGPNSSRPNYRDRKKLQYLKFAAIVLQNRNLEHHVFSL